MEYEAHPLFLPEDDEDPVPVDEIQIARIEQGQQVFYPRLFSAGELTTLDQITAELGGGNYILIARHDKRISTRRKVALPGKPKPMYDEGRTEKEEKKPAEVTSLDPMAAMMGGQNNGIWGLIMMMMQQMMQQQAQAAQNQMQMFMTIMTTSQQTSSEEKRQAREELQANIERERLASERTMALMREMMQTRASNSDPGEAFNRGVEFMRQFSTQQIEMVKSQIKGEETDWGSLLNTLGEVLQGVQLFKGMGAPLPEGAPVPTPEVQT